MHESDARVNTMVTTLAHAHHSIDETPKDQGRVARESVVLDPMQFEKEKVFQLVLDSSRQLEESLDSDIYGSQMQRKRFSGYKETSFDSLHSVDHLFVTDSVDIDSEDFAVMLGSERALTRKPADQRAAKSNKKISKLKETLRKDNGGHHEGSLSGATQSLRDDSMIEGELQKIYQKINSFTLEQFQELRGQIKKQGYITGKKPLDNTFDDLPSELLLTEDTRGI